MSETDLTAFLQTRDRHRLTKKLQQAKSKTARDKVWGQIAQSAAKTQHRLSQREPITLGQALPISLRADEIRKAVEDHQVVIVCGETGSGKTTQLPKILMQAGLGARGMIGHTQPRRLAARSVAQRIADELETPFGGLVGYKTRFDGQTSADTQVKLMTDGILLAETGRDRFLNQYEAIIIDEAHERTLNIDFLLGYLKRLLPKRPDLKIIVTSATIDPERFSEFFDKAPIVNVAGRGYPVSIEYRPQDNSVETPVAIEQSVYELWRQGPGDILVFLPGERDIRDTEQHLSKALAHSRFAGAEILPLYARLSRRAQNKIFSGRHGRRIILSTNVAETSLTVPGIHYVIDTGLARISRYSSSARIQRLPIEPVSQASCNQRSGRCGRIAPGTCIRLFSQEEFEQRPEFTDPEILRTNLANVLLTMADLRLGYVDQFPFIEPPQPRYIRDGRNLLTQLQALDDKARITPLGRKLARLPLDPRMGRMLVAGDKAGLLPALRVLCAGLTIQDPRERPAQARQAADGAHAQFLDKRSDFVSLLKLWDAYGQVKSTLSNNQLRKWCQKHFLNFMRMREWEDLVRQLRRIGHQVGLTKQIQKGHLATCDYEHLHSALLPGLLDQFGRLDEGNKSEKGLYQGARGRKFKIFPGSGVFKKMPRWIVAGELIETSRLYAHTVAMIETTWLEKAAQHLIKREYYDPHWSKRRGHCAAKMRVKLFGQTLSDGHKVDFGRIDPKLAREIFIRDGLVAGQVMNNRGQMPKFLAYNQQIVEEITQREARFRRRDLLVDELTRERFYDQRLPEAVIDRKSLMRWIGTQGDQSLRFEEQALLNNAGLELPEQAFPETIEIGGAVVELHYEFKPGKDQDGITVHLPLPLLHQFPEQRCAWLVPGLLEQKLTEMLKALPKRLRRQLVPVPDYARALVERLTFGQGNLESQIRQAVFEMTGLEIPTDAWQDYQPSAHLTMGFQVVGEKDLVLAAGTQLTGLKAKLSDRAKEHVQTSDLANQVQQKNIQEWPEGQLAQAFELKRSGTTFKAMAVLTDQGNSVNVELLTDLKHALIEHRQGVIRLLALALAKPIKMIVRDLESLKTLAVYPWPQAPEDVPVSTISLETIDKFDQPPLIADLIYALLNASLQTLPKDESEFLAYVAQHKKWLVQQAHELWQQLKPALMQVQKAKKRLGKELSLDAIECAKDINHQLERLVFVGFISQLRNPLKDAKHIRRYAQAVNIRLDKLKQNGSLADKKNMQQISLYDAKLAKLAGQAKPQQWPEALVDLRWLIEEYRVQVFAQQLGTAVKVSPKRLDKLLQKLR